MGAGEVGTTAWEVATEECFSFRLGNQAPEYAAMLVKDIVERAPSGEKNGQCETCSDCELPLTEPHLYGTNAE